MLRPAALAWVAVSFAAAMSFLKYCDQPMPFSDSPLSWGSTSAAFWKETIAAS